SLRREPWALIKQMSKWPLNPMRLLLQALLSWFKQSELSGKSPAALMRDDFFGLRLGQLLHYEDRNGMAFSLESRNPFADDQKLAEWALGQGEELSSRLHNGYSKGALRQAAKGLVPEALLQRIDKKGFTVPDTALTLRSLSEWKEAIFHERLNAHVSQEMRKKAWKRLAKNAKDHKAARYLFRCASLSYYLKFVVSRHEPSQPD
ncbi:MAG: asparagine synthase C-terminal domain-containing protein, partial [Bacteroidetes bacterium]|nr:asparagine synthase C-terminal domain-containing protein [Bacteroidota bacterium]